MTDLDPVIHAPKRLRILAVLSALDGVESAYLREHLDLTAPDLSKQMRVLEEAGYVEVRKTGHGPGSTTWYRLSGGGRRAFDDYTRTLRSLLGEGAGSEPQ